MEQDPEQRTASSFIKKAGKHWKAILILAVAAAIAVTIAIVVATIQSDKEMVRGIDVSAYQGEIDWEKIANQGYKFAYIKATEGTTHIDKQFKTNWDGAKEAGLYRGAYFFLTLNKSGAAQAAHFLKTVPSDEKALPAVIDFELYGDYLKKLPSQEKIDSILKPAIRKIKAKTGKNPIIYTNYNTYNQYMKSSYQGIAIWICDLSNTSPKLSGGHQWVFWQHTQRGLIDGINNGDQQFVDLDIYNGNYKQFKKFVKQ